MALAEAQKEITALNRRLASALSGEQEEMLIADSDGVHERSFEESAEPAVTAHLWRGNKMLHY